MRLKLKSIFTGLLFGAGTLFFLGCTTDQDIVSQDDVSLEGRSIFTNLAQATNLIGLTPTNELVFLKSGPPAKETGMVPISGLRDGEFMLAIDRQPTSGLQGGLLYGVSSMSRLYTIDLLTGIANPMPVDTFRPEISGQLIGFDYNIVDATLRLVTDQGQNLRLSPLTGEVLSVEQQFPDTEFNFNSIAYAAKPGSTSSTLYYIDLLNQGLYKDSPLAPNRPQLVGQMGFIFEGEGGFEIVGTSLGFTVQYGNSLLDMASGSNGFDDTRELAHRLLLINLNNGRATSYGRTRPLIGLALR